MSLALPSEKRSAGASRPSGAGGTNARIDRIRAAAMMPKTRSQGMPEHKMPEDERDLIRL